MAITYFNWNEICTLARDDFAAIVILTYAQTKRYNESLTWKGTSLLQLLHIHHIPAFLFQQGTLDSIKGNIYCRYKTKEAQSYILNSKVLTYNVNAKMKTFYIKALSMRRISEKVNYIPRNYLNEKEIDNPFLTEEHNFIHFRYESLATEIS